MAGVRDRRSGWWMTDQRLRQGIGCGFGGAIVAAPFVAWFWGTEAAVAVMALALAATSALALDASRTAEPAMARRLRGLAVVNGVVLGVCAMLLLVLVTD